MATMNPFFGILFLIGGLALSVFLGVALYKDKSK
jgi:hypothetical protein